MRAKEKESVKEEEKDLFETIDISCVNIQGDDIREIFDFLYEYLPVNEICGDEANGKTKDEQYEIFFRFLQGYDLVVRKDGRVIGYGELMSNTEEYASLFNFVIDKKYRREGLGSHLLSCFKDFCYRYGIKRIIIATEVLEEKDGAIPFFEKNDFKKCEERDDIYLFNLE